jgi:hypothetical protein
MWLSLDYYSCWEKEDPDVEAEHDGTNCRNVVALG